jgi:hypothetical protein
MALFTGIPFYIFALCQLRHIPQNMPRTSVFLQGHLESSLLPTALLYGPYPPSTGGPSTVQDICVMEDPSSIGGGLSRPPPCESSHPPSPGRPYPLCLAPSLRHSRPSPPPLCLRPRCRTRTGASRDLRHYPWTFACLGGTGEGVLRDPCKQFLM